MTQRLLDPRMFDSSQALPAMSGAALTNVPSGFEILQYAPVATAAAAIDITWSTAAAAAYPEMKLFLYGYGPTTANTICYMQIYENTVLNTSTYRWHGIVIRSNSSSSGQINNNAAAAIQFVPNLAGFYMFAASSNNAEITINTGATSYRPGIDFRTTYLVSDSSQAHAWGGGTGFATGLPVTGVRLQATSGNIQAGYVLAGLKTE
jgi:hypothetical protein